MRTRKTLLSGSLSQNRMSLIVTLALAILLFFNPDSSFAKKLVVVAWDGAGLNNVGRLMDEGRLPNLKSILEGKGSLVKLETIARTGSLCSYTHVFTGLMYEQTGVVGNYDFDTFENGVLRKVYNENTHIFDGLNFFLRPIPYSHTIIQAIQDQGNRIGWFVSSGKVGNNPLKSALSEIGIKADSYSIAVPWDEGDNYIWTLTDKTIDFMKKNNSRGFLTFLHIGGCDGFGHRLGEDSPRYEEEIIRADVSLGKILENRNQYTKILVFADHGFEDGKTRHRNAPDVWMVTDLPIREKYFSDGGTMRDVANTILKWFNIDDKSRIPQMRGKSLLLP
jgi:predicted AlkP superfamily pyrophosphatase or phosphodiesterase